MVSLPLPSYTSERSEHGQGEFVLDRIWRAIEIHRVMAKSIDVARQIRTDESERLSADRWPSRQLRITLVMVTTLWKITRLATR